MGISLPSSFSFIFKKEKSSQYPWSAIPQWRIVILHNMGKAQLFLFIPKQWRSPSLYPSYIIATMVENMYTGTIRVLNVCLLSTCIWWWLFMSILVNLLNIYGDHCKLESFWQSEISIYTFRSLSKSPFFLNFFIYLKLDCTCSSFGSPLLE